MTDIAPPDLEEEVARFRAWTRATRQRPEHYAACYPHWDRVRGVVERTVASGSVAPETSDLLLDLLPHDHDREQLLELVGACPMIAFQVAARGACNPEAAIRVEVVALLGRLATLGALELLSDLTRDPDQAVRRRALSCLRQLDPGLAERLGDGES